MTKIIIVIAVVLIVVAMGGYTGAQWIARSPLKVRILEYKRLTKEEVSVKYEVENTSAFPVMAIGWLGFYGRDPSGFDGYDYIVGDFWKGRRFQPGEKFTDEIPVLLSEAHPDEERFFLYAWDPMPAHSLRKLLPRYRTRIDMGPMPFRVGSDGPFTFEEVAKAKP
jgi:hypothetical protein